MLISKLYNRYKKPLKLYWWRYDYPNRLNFGDEITPIIIESLFGRRCVWAPPDECELAGAGSIIELLQNESKGNHIKVWGSGFIKDGPDNKSDNLEFYVVRGDKSLSRIKKQNIHVGDPGLLMSVAMPGLSKLPKKYKIGVIPHYVDQENQFIQKCKDAGYRIINVLDTPYGVARQINECEIIFSSSLHGLIVSESFGVPNYWIKLSSKVTGDGYKFYDYGSSIKRTMRPVSTASLMKGQEINKLINTYKMSTIQALQKDLLKSFPL